jgi:hypothetical protein
VALARFSGTWAVKTSAAMLSASQLRDTKIKLLRIPMNISCSCRDTRLSAALVPRFSRLAMFGICKLFSKFRSALLTFRGLVI